MMYCTGARGQGVKMEAPRVTLGNLDTAHVTCEALLANTKLVPTDARWVVTRFTVSITMPDGKTYGPYAGQGAELPEAAIKTIKRLKKNKAEISIQEINVSYGGREKFTYPVILRYNN
jgi:hypothetical protein